MGLKELIQTAIRIAKMKPVQALIALLIMTNGIQLGLRIKSDSVKDIKIDRLDKDNDDCREEKLTMQKYYAEKIDSVKTQAYQQTINTLENWNSKVEEALQEQKEANKIQQNTLHNLRKK
jgi:hypothetical protein